MVAAPTRQVRMTSTQSAAEQPRSARITDVARVAGVSPQTVSNVVNKRGGFTEDTRRLVLAAIERTGYRPNRAARQLRTQRTQQLGFVLEDQNLDVRNPFTLALLAAIVGAAERAGYRVVVLIGDPRADDVVDRWAGEVDGLMLGNVTPGDLRTHALAARGVPFMVMGRTAPDEPQAWVDIRNDVAIAQVVDLLVDRGHTRFGYIGYDGDQHWTVERREGARARLREHGIMVGDEAVLSGPYRLVRPALDALLSGPRRPTALVTGSDSLAVMAMNQARALGLEVGRDVAITGFDGLGTADVYPALTTVRVPVEAVAQTMVDRLLREVGSGPTGEPGVFLTTELVLGGSA